MGRGGYGVDCALSEKKTELKGKYKNTQKNVVKEEIN